MGAFTVWLVQILGAWFLVAVAVFLRFFGSPPSGYAVTRSLVTAGTVIALAHSYGFTTGNFLKSVISKYLVLAAIAAIILVCLSLVYVAVGRHGSRGARLGRLFIVQDVGTALPGPLSVMLFIIGSGSFLYWATIAATRYPSFVALLSVLLLLLPILAFLIIVPFSVVGTVFHAANAHPALPPLAAPFIAGAAVVFDRYTGEIIATPENLQHPLAISGIIAVVIISAVELADLHGQGYGISEDP